MGGMEDSPVRAKSFSFACDIITFARALKEKREYELASQLIRSGTGIGANIREAQRGVSRKDFSNKLGIALKEADESLYWLELIEATSNLEVKDLKHRCEELIKMLVAIRKKTESI